MLSRIVSLFIILILTACSSPRFVLDKQKTTASELLKGIEKEQAKIATISGESRISIETSEYSGNFFADIIYNDNDSLLVDISGPFGIGIGKLFLGNNRFIFLNQFSNQFYSGNTAQFKNRNFLQFPLKIHEIADFFIGKDPISNMKIEKFDIDNEMFFIRGKNVDFTYNIWIDNLSGKIKKMEYYKQDLLILSKEYDKFVKFENTFFPKHIKLTRPSEKQVVSVFYNNVEINQKIVPSEFTVKISDSARQIDLNLIEPGVEDSL